MTLFSQNQLLLLKKGQRRWHSSLVDAVLLMKELFFEWQFLKHFQQHCCAPLENPPVTELVQPHKTNGHVVGACFFEKLTSQESSRAGREGSERIRDPSREKQFPYFMAPYVFQTQCILIMGSPQGWSDVAHPPTQFSHSQTELDLLADSQ